MPISSKKRKNDHVGGTFREIFFASSRELAPFALVFVYNPENFDEKQLGTIFGVIKISDTAQESSFIANLLASVIKKEYFSNPSRPVPDSFEASLRKANLALAELARQGSVKWIGKISFAGGVLEKNNLHFSKLGTTSILLLRSGMIADIGAGMGDDSPETDSHPLKTFSDISSGKIEKNDCLIFSTADLLEIFSLEELRQSASRFSREEFPDIISASLTSNSELSGAIVVNLVEEKKTLPAAEKEERKKFFPIAQKYPAPETIQPEEIPPSAPIAPHMDIPPAPPLSTPKTVRKNSVYISEADDIIPKKTIAKKFFETAGNVSSQTIFAAKNTRKKIFSFFGWIAWGKICSSIKTFFLHGVNLSKKIKWQKKSARIAAAVVAVLVLFLIAFPFIKALIKKNSVPGTPVPIAQNPAPPGAPDDTNLKTVENISEIATIPSDSRELLSLGDALFVLTGDKSILKINPANGETESADSSIASGKFTLAAVMPDLSTIFILTDDKKVISFTPSNKKFQENSLAFPDNLNAADMKTYLTYIYFLDPTANQIYRYPRAEGGFGNRQDWLKSGQDLKGADKFTINDDIFAANNINIIPFLQGQMDGALDFQKTQVPLRIDSIFTAPGLENVYLLDNANHRIIKYSKDGKIVAQYWNNSITGIKDFTVDEKNNVVYLQKSNSISKFSIN